MPALDLADEVRVAVDQAGKHGVVRQVDVDGPVVVRSDRLDALATHDQELIGQHLAGDDLDQAPGPDPRDVGHGSGSRNEGSADRSATSIWAFCSLPE